MTLVTIDARDQADRETLAAVRREIRELRKSISSFRDQIERGEDIDTKAMIAEVRRSTQLFDACLAVENRLEEQTRKDARIGPCGYGLDLDLARNTIRCKLHRLRACGDTG